MEPPYRLLYALGLTPWEREWAPSAVSALADELSASGGRALDVGCGSGRDAVYLAVRGWRVTGVDRVGRALVRAERRAHTAGVEVNWVLGDVTRLGALQIAGNFDLVLDRGCFHGLRDDRRRRVAFEITALAGDRARLLLYAFQPRARGLGPRGVTCEQLERYFIHGWELLSSTPAGEDGLPPWLGDARPTWYDLKRHS